MNFSLPPMLGFGLVLIRTSTLVASAPILSSKSIPQRIKLVFSLFIAIIAWSAAGTPNVAVPDGFLGLSALVASEALLGLASGLSSRVLIDAAQAGGQTAAMSMGFGFGQLIDPNSHAESTTIGELFSILALGAALTMGVHTEAISWLVRSVNEVPPGGTIDVTSLASALFRQVIFAVTLSVRVAYPLFAASLFAYSVLGMLGKAAPQLSLSNIGFAVSIIAGGGALYLVAPEGARMCASAALQVFSRG